MSATGRTKFERPVELPAENCPAYILCGGQSARFGTDKARVMIDQQPLLNWLANNLRDHGHEVHFVADRAERYRDLDVTCIVDAQSESGPMAGLLTALRHRANTCVGWSLIVTCDQLLWQRSYFQSLASQINAKIQAIAYADTTIQPLPGLYHTQLEPTIAANLAQGERSIKRVLQAIPEVVVTIHSIENPRQWCFNSPAELSNLFAKLKGSGPDSDE